MHTALCTFDDRASAERARDRLLQAGFDPRDVHLQQREAETGSVTQDPQAWGGLEHEVAVGPRVLASFSRFFDALLGERHPQADLYAGHVEGGRTVLVVDDHDHAQVERARALLNDMQPGDLQALDRTGQRPLRELVAERDAATAAGVGRASSERPAAWNEERAAAAGNLSDDLDRVGLRYAAEDDKPSRDGLGRRRDDE